MGSYLFPSLRGYERSWLRTDLIAGLTVWAVLVPEALAYASIAGVSPVVGLYAAPAALIFYAAFGSSRQLIAGPMSATAALSAATIGDIVAPGSSAFLALTTTLAIATGMVTLAAGLLRLGFLANFISEPVVKGFIVGLALTIIIGQVPGLIGVQGGSGDFFEKLWALLPNLQDADIPTAVIGIGSLLSILTLKRLNPSAPGALVLSLLGIVLVAAFSLQDHGVAIVGTIASGLPPLGPPDIPSGHWGDLLAGGVGVMLVGFAEGLGAARTYAHKEHELIDPNKELVGTGIGNLGAGVTGGMVVNGSLSKTAVNAGAGAKSQLSGLFVAVLVVLTLIFLTGLFEKLPEATLSAIVIAAVIELVDFPSLAKLFQIPGKLDRARLGVASRPDFIAASAALFGVLIFDTLPGLAIGVGVSILLLLYRNSKPHIAILGQIPGSRTLFADVERHPGLDPIEGAVLLRVEGSIFFANAETVCTRIRQEGDREGINTVILDAETVPFIDVTAMEALNELAVEFRDEDRLLVMARGVDQIAEELRRSGADAPWKVYPSVHEAVEAVRENQPDTIT